MVKLITSIIAISLLLTFTATTCVHASQQAEKQYFRNLCSGNEIPTKIRIYVQDRVTGADATIFEVARSILTSNSTTSFGLVRVMDNLLTAEPEIDSAVVGRLQGFITFSDMENLAATMNLNFYFTSGDYNGSTISMLGRNELLNEERELPIVGGTGVFRMATGYALSSTYSYNVQRKNGILVYVLYIYGTSTDANQHPSM